MSAIRSRWAAVGAAIAVSLGAGGIGLVSATSPSAAATFVPVVACRVLDTRPSFQVGPRSTPLGAEETITVLATGNTGECTSVPATATGVVLNVTATDASQATYLTIWETDQGRPNASSLNPVPGQPPTPNAVTTGIDGDGKFDIYNLQGRVHMIVDIVGYYTDHHHDDRYYTKQQSDALVSPLIASGPLEMDPGTERVLGGTDTMDIVASCDAAGPSGQILVRFTVAGHVAGVQSTVDSVLDAEGVRETSVSVPAGADYAVAEAVPSFQNLQAMSFTAIAGNTSISGEAYARSVGFDGCLVTFNGIVATATP